MKKILIFLFVIALLVLGSSASFAATDKQTLDWEKKWLDIERGFLESKINAPDEMKDFVQYIKDLYSENLNQYRSVNVLLYCNKQGVSVYDIMQHAEKSSYIDLEYRTAIKCISDYARYGSIEYDENQLEIKTIQALGSNPTLGFLRTVAIGSIENYQDFFVGKALQFEDEGKYYDAADTYLRLMSLITGLESDARVKVASFLVGMDKANRDAFKFVYLCSKDFPDDNGYQLSPDDEKKNRFEKLIKNTNPISYKKGIPCVDQRLKEGQKQGALTRYRLLRIGLRSSLFRYVLKSSYLDMKLLMANLKEYYDLINEIEVLEEQYKEFKPDSIQFSRLGSVQKVVILTQRAKYLAEHNFKTVKFSKVKGLINCGYGAFQGSNPLRTLEEKESWYQHPIVMITAGGALAIIGGPTAIAVGTVAFTASGVFSVAIDSNELANVYTDINDVERTEKICGIALETMFTISGVAEGIHQVNAAKTKVRKALNENKIPKNSLTENTADISTGSVATDVDSIGSSSQNFDGLSPSEQASNIESAAANEIETPIDQLTNNLPEEIKPQVTEAAEEIGYGVHCSPHRCLTPQGNDIINQLAELRKSTPKQKDLYAYLNKKIEDISNEIYRTSGDLGTAISTYGEGSPEAIRIKATLDALIDERKSVSKAGNTFIASTYNVPEAFRLYGADSDYVEMMDIGPIAKNLKKTNGIDKVENYFIRQRYSDDLIVALIESPRFLEILQQNGLNIADLEPMFSKKEPDFIMRILEDTSDDQLSSTTKKSIRKLLEESPLPKLISDALFVIGRENYKDIKSIKLELIGHGVFKRAFKLTAEFPDGKEVFVIKKGVISKEDLEIQQTLYEWGVAARPLTDKLVVEIDRIKDPGNVDVTDEHFKLKVGPFEELKKFDSMTAEEYIDGDIYGEIVRNSYALDGVTYTAQQMAVPIAQMDFDIFINSLKLNIKTRGQAVVYHNVDLHHSNFKIYYDHSKRRLVAKAIDWDSREQFFYKDVSISENFRLITTLRSYSKVDITSYFDHTLELFKVKFGVVEGERLFVSILISSIYEQSQRVSIVDAHRLVDSSQIISNYLGSNGYTYSGINIKKTVNGNVVFEQPVMNFIQIEDTLSR